MIPNTFQLPATADDYVVIHDESRLCRYLQEHDLSRRPFFVVGSGSNVVFARHFPGTVLHLDTRGIRRLPSSSDGEVLVEAAAGEVWDSFVRHCVAQGWYGLENLVAIPGTVGASPVQNVGAYGAEAKDFVAEVRTYDLLDGRPRVFTNAECRFAYRDSLFKHQTHPLTPACPRYVVVSVVYRLSTLFRPNLTYKALSDHFGRQQPTAEQLVDVVSMLRWGKLPRPEEVGSAGSFFKNPVVGEDHYQRLKADHPDIVAYPVKEGYKLAAGWLIERAGWKGRDMGRCGVYEKQALVLVNRGGCMGEEVLALADAVTADVQRLFSVRLEKEAIILS